MPGKPTTGRPASRAPSVRAPPVQTTSRSAPSRRPREAGERLLGVARVARADDAPAPRDPARQLVAADGEERALEALAEGGGGELAADRRAAHPAEQHPGGLGLAEARRSTRQRASRSWSGMPRTSSIMVRPALFHPCRGRRRRALRPARRRRRGRGSSGDRGAGAGLAAVEEDRAGDLGPGADPAARGDDRPRANRRAAASTSAPAPTKSPGAVGRTRVATRPSRMSQVARR